MRRVGREIVDAGVVSVTRSVTEEANAGAGSDSPLPDKILRFLKTERLLHWALALPFLGCLTSASVLVIFYNPDPTRPYRYLFAWAHRGCGAALFVLPTLVLLTSGRNMRVLLYNVRQAWVWTFDDLRWLVLMGLSNVFKGIVLPDQGKFNAAEKLNFMMVMVFTPLWIASGIAIWLPDYTSLDPLVPWVFHTALAATAIPLILGHMFMATVNPATRVGLSGMITGWVSREWAEHHYARWFREQFPHLVAVIEADPGSGAEAVTAASVDAPAWTAMPAPLEQASGAVGTGESGDDDEWGDGGEDRAECVLDAYFAAATDCPSEAMVS